MTHSLRQSTAGRFTEFEFDPETLQLAMQVSPLFLAYLQNKIAAYAGNVVDQKLPYDADPGKQLVAIIALEKAKTFVEAYEELLSELTDA